MNQTQAFSSSLLRGLQRIVTALEHGIDSLLNGIFSLTHGASKVRSRALFAGFLVAWMLAVLFDVPVPMMQLRWDEFAATITQEKVFAFLFTLDVQILFAALSKGMALLFATIFHPEVLRHLIVLYAPYWLMYRLSAIYLADIFEKDDKVARTFIRQAAFGSKYSTISIGQGKILEKDEASTIVQIGGPGKIVVELDSAVLFERPDGTPHVIGPTTGEVVDDFERIRRVIDLRDVIDRADLSTRSKDGIIVGARDIQYSYSIFRGDVPARNLQTPYPFLPAAVENLVYGDARPVKPGIAPPRVQEWRSPTPGRMAGQIIGEMGTFISKRGLGEFLANIGEPEEKSLLEREQEIGRRGQQLSGVAGDLPSNSPVAAGEFSSRAFLTSLFYTPDGFKKRASGKGFQLNWIGVGTWDLPEKKILEKHREAWLLSRENFSKGNPQALRGLQDETRQKEMLRMVQEIPVNRYYLAAQHNAEDETIIEELLQAYHEVLDNAAELYRRDSLPVPESVQLALAELRRWRTSPFGDSSAYSV